MQRRSLFGGLAVLMLAPMAGAQAQSMPGAAAPDRPRITEMRWDELPARRRRRVQQRLAGEGNPPLMAEDARRMWDEMTPRQRRQAIRRREGETQRADRPRRQREAQMGDDPSMTQPLPPLPSLTQ